MYKNLKRKLVLIILAILFIFLSSILGFIYYQSYQSIYSKMNNEIENIEETNQIQSTRNILNFRRIVITLEEEIITSISSVFFEEETAYAVINLLEDQKGSVSYNEELYQYIIVNDEATTIVLYNITQETQYLETLLVTLSSILIISIFITGIISYLFVHITIKPVEQAHKKQQQFISNASHELKTPLSIINTNNDIIKTVLPKEHHNWVNINKENIKKMNKLIIEMLYLSKLTEHNNQSIKEQLNIKTEIINIIKSYEPKLQIQKLHLSKNLIDETIHFNKEQFHQLINILLDNAIKYTPTNNSITITSYKKNSTTYIECSNTGITIPKNKLPNIFDRFYKTDESRNNDNSFGLGLAIAQELCIKNNSTIDVTSTNNKTTFTITIKK